MQELTKAEEQVMNVLWKLEKGFLKDIVEDFPEPKPAYTTISTVLRVLVKKEFVGYKSYSKVNEYFPLIKKSGYFKSLFSNIASKFFNGSHSSLASYFAETENISLAELEEMKLMIQHRIDEKKNK